MTTAESLRDFAIFQAGWLLRRAEAMTDSPDEAMPIDDAFQAVAYLVHEFRLALLLEGHVADHLKLLADG